MRKRTVKCIADTIFWYILYFLPVVVYLLYLFVEPGTGSATAIISMESIFNSVGLGIVADNVIISSLSSIFGASGTLPLFSTNTPFIIFTWFISVYIVHLAVDFLLFIPRLAHKWMDTYSKE